MKDYFFNVLKEKNNYSSKSEKKNNNSRLEDKSIDKVHKENNIEIKSSNNEESLVKYSNSINFLLSLLKDSVGKEKKLYVNIALNLIDKLKNSIKTKIQLDNLNSIRKYLKSIKNNRYNLTSESEIKLNLFLLEEKEDKLFNSSITNISTYKSDSEYWNISEKTRDKSKSSYFETQSHSHQLQNSEEVNFKNNCKDNRNILHIYDFYQYDKDFLIKENEESYNQNSDLKDDLQRKNSLSTIDLINVFDNESNLRYDITSMNENYSFCTNSNTANSDLNIIKINNQSHISHDTYDNHIKLKKIPEYLSDNLITNNHALKYKNDLNFFLACKRMNFNTEERSSTLTLESLSDKEDSRMRKNQNIYLKQYNNLFLNE